MKNPLRYRNGAELNIALQRVTCLATSVDVVVQKLDKSSSIGVNDCVDVQRVDRAVARQNARGDMLLLDIRRLGRHSKNA